MRLDVFYREKWKLVVVLLGFGLVGIGFAAESNEKSFKLREVSVFGGDNKDFLRGQMCRCQEKPFSEVKSYPKFVSQAPIFGEVRFNERNGDTNSGAHYYFAVDESKGSGKGYDSLYFDSNRDLNLTNDTIVKVQKQAPDKDYSPNFSSIKQKRSFDFLQVNLSTNGNTTNLVEIMPRLLLTGNETNTYQFMLFVRTHFFEGNLQINGNSFLAQLGNDYAITDFNSPGTALVLSKGGSFDWWGGDRISAMHKVNGRFFSLSATSSGEVTVHPYQGDQGTFEVGPGARKLTNFSLRGSLQSKDHSVAAGGDIKDGRPVAAPNCEIPVGDYLPEFLTLEFGRLKIELSQNYHSEGKRQTRDGRPEVYGIQIRKDRPFALDFSNKPEVMFASPAPNQKVKPGDTVMVMAVLIDPKLDIMIRRLEDTSRTQTNDVDGKPLQYKRNLSLDPKVLITRTNGEKVAEGVMPFG